MAVRRGALARWRRHLEEVIGVEDASAVVDPFATVDWSALLTREDLEAELGPVRADLRRLEHDLRRLEHDVRGIREDMKDLRRDLLKVTGAQFFALIAAVAAVLGLS